MEIENAIFHFPFSISIFQDLENFGKEMIFEMAMRKCWIVWKKSNHILQWM